VSAQVNYDNVTVIRTTAKAICCRFGDDPVDHWIAVNQIAPGSEVRALGQSGRLIVSEWLAKNAHLPPGKTTMSDENNYTDNGMLFKNGDKKEDKQPDYKGDLNFTCPGCGIQTNRQLAGWIRIAATGAKFLTLSFKPRYLNYFDRKPRRDSDNQQGE
jgi:hypothetical protein